MKKLNLLNLIRNNEETILACKICNHALVPKTVKKLRQLIFFCPSCQQAFKLCKACQQLFQISLLSSGIKGYCPVCKKTFAFCAHCGGALRDTDILESSVYFCDTCQTIFDLNLIPLKDWPFKF